MSANNLADLYELTPLQHGMLFQQLYAPTDGAYTEQAVLSLRGALDREAFWRAWQLVVDRHPALRTTFHWDKVDNPLQAVHRRVTLPREEVDWRDLPREVQDKQLRVTLLEQKRRGLDLTTPPPFRITLYQVGDQRYHVAMRFSHLVTDGWSMGLILSEFIAAYRAYAGGRAPILAPAPGFREYVAWWQRQQPEAVADFWREHLADYRPPPPLRLGPVPPVPADGMPVEWQERVFDDLTGPLRAFSQQHRLSLHTLTQGAWTLVLARCGQVDDLAVATTLAHRPAEVPGAEGIVGCLLVTVPVRTRIDPDQPVRDWLAGLQDAVIAVRDHAGASLTDIQRWTTGRSTDLFESAVSFQNFPLPAAGTEHGGLTLEKFSLDARVPVPLVLMPMPGDPLTVRVIYDRRRFAPEQAELLLGRLHAALTSIVHDGPVAVREVNVLAEPDRRLLVRPAAAPDPDLLAAIRQQVARRPEAVAVGDADRSLTYRQLDQHADRVAAGLAAAGVAPGEPVAVAVPRGAEAVATLLGVLRAGAVCLPVDPQEPDTTLAGRLTAAAAGTVLCAERDADRFGDHARRVLTVERLPEPVTTSADPAGDGPAYLLTDDDPSRPVRLDRPALGRACASFADLTGLTDADVVTCLHPLSHPGSLTEVWPALAAGARLAVLPADATVSGPAVAGLLARESATVTVLDPAGLAALATTAARDGLPHRPRQLVVRDGHPDPQAVRSWFDTAGGGPLLLVSGPAAAAGLAFQHRLSEPGDDPAEGTVLGLPTAGLAGYVLDQAGRPLPAGAAGELYLVGPVLGSPTGTDDRFVTVQFAQGPPLPAYRTGLPVRQHPSGEITRLESPTPTPAVGRAAVPADRPTGETGRPPTETEQAVAELVAELLHLDQVGVHDDLGELGLHSLLGTRLVNRIRDRWQTPLSLATVFERPTVAHLAAAIEAGGSATAAVAGAMPDLAADVTLDESITAEGLAPPRPRPQQVLLTGATGYLGSVLLERLLRTREVTVTCLVRDEAPARALERLRQRLRAAGRWDEAFTDRIRCCPGNLARPRLGLDDDTFADLAEQIDEIYHLGASANILPPYRRVRPTNVRGTQEVLRLATTTRLKPVHYISPAEVTDHAEAGLAGQEAALPDEPAESLHNGYIQSKWVADRIVSLAAARGVPTVTYRAARLIGSPDCPHWKLGDGVSEIARACTRLGMVPDSQVRVPVSPVDYVAAGIAALAGQGESRWGGHFHLLAGRPFTFDDLAEAMRRGGWRVRRVPLERWYAELVRVSQRDERGRWDVVLAALGPWVRAARQGSPEPEYHRQAAEAALADLVPAPAVDADYLVATLDQLRRAGHLEPPTGGAEADLSDGELAQVREWESIFDGVYQQPADTGLGEDFSGWNSSYDGTPIPLEQMRQWRDTTVDRLRALRPRRVLEVGFGSGLLLAHLAGDCEHYWGADLSGPVVSRLASQIGTVPRLASRVTLWQAAAHELVDDPGPVAPALGTLDLVVINSVINYFPGADYLRQVLAWAVRAVASGGAVFCGDLRNLRLLRCFHTAVRSRGRDDADPDRLRRDVRRAVALEKELVLDPEFFTDLATGLPELGAVQVLVKRGRAHNELTRYRYDVVLRRGPVPDEPDEPEWVWGTQVADLADLAGRLTGHRPARVRVAGVPNARLTAELAADRRLFGEPADLPAGIEPEDLVTAAEAAGYQAALTWSGRDAGQFDAVLTPADAPPPQVVVTRPGGAPTLANQPVTTLDGERS